MLSYIQKFTDLPKEIKNAVASPEASAQISAIGKKYNVDLASTVMKVMVKEVTLETLGAYLINQLNVPAETAKSLERDLRKYIFSPVIDYLLEATPGPKLVFAESDEREVKAGASVNATEDFDASIEEAVGRVVTKSHISLSDPLTSGKFHQVIKTYLRGSRDSAATLQALTKAAELGGVALSRDAAERAMSVATTEFSLLQKITLVSQVKISVPEDKLASPFLPIKETPVLNQADYNLEATLKSEGRLKKATIVKPILDAKHELAPLVPEIMPEKSKASISVPVSNSKTLPVAAPVRRIVKEALSGKPIDRKGLREMTEAKPKPIVNMPTSPSGKIKMDDVRFTPQVLSPVDELRYMTVKTFRRLNPDPLKAIEKIKEKLELLARDDYGKKIEGIVAWHDSPLSNLYLSLCRRALDENKSVTEILEAEAKKEPLTLKPEELNAIIALNRNLKF